MPAKLLTGKEVAQKMDQDIQAEVQALKGRGIDPALRIMIVGDAEDSVFYANSAKKMAEKNGILCDIEQLPERQARTSSSASCSSATRTGRSTESSSCGPFRSRSARTW